jgi:hypothetical protein
MKGDRTMDMPTVKGCEMTSCAFNREGACHAMAITIGGNGCPDCDTMVNNTDVEAGDPESCAGVGACKVMSCAHNERLECSAGGIDVGQFGDMAACRTYEKRT